MLIFSSSLGTSYGKDGEILGDVGNEGDLGMIFEILNCVQKTL
jgi:hypothetical protein